MSTQSEENPANPLDALDTLVGRPRRPSERLEMRLAAVSGGTLHGFRPDSLRSTVAAGDPLESAMSEFARRRIKSEAEPAPPDLARGSASRMGIGNVMGLAAAVVVACFAALLFVTLFPGEKDPLQAFAAATAPHEISDALKQEPAREIDAVNGDGMSRDMSKEQSERLLQQFVQWRQKVVVTEKQ